MSGAVSLRVGDDDRARATALLGEHYAHGRLDLAEFDERSTLAMMAVHQHELDALLADLPTLGEFRDGAPSVPGRRTRPSPRPPVALLVLLGVALVVLTQGAALWFLPLLWWAAGASRHRHSSRTHPIRRSLP